MTNQELKPAYLQCDPRSYIVNLSDNHQWTCELKFTVVIKCTDEMLHNHNDFWLNPEWRLQDNNNDIVAAILKLIGTNVFSHCYSDGSLSVTDKKYGVNSIFNLEGWNEDCFEITEIKFENSVNMESFDISPVES